MVTTKSAHVRQEDIATSVRRLEAGIARYERRYECSSAEIILAIRDGRAKETADISRWLTNFRTLLDLRAIRGGTTGSRTPTT